jgi:hypothetical protein
MHTRAQGMNAIGLFFNVPQWYHMDMKTLITFSLLMAAGFVMAPFGVFAGPDQDLGDFKVFPDDNVWKWDISNYQVHPNSAKFLASMGTATMMHPDFGTVWAGAPIGIPYLVVTSSQPLVPIVYTDYGDESDPGPFPIPLSAAIEGGSASTGDRHVITVDKDRKILCELYYAFPKTATWEASSGAKFDLTINDNHPLGWTSADAAGLPIFPGLVRYEEVYLKKEVNHAIRMTVQNSQKAYIFPARHYASSSTDTTRPPMGLRLRMKAGYDISRFSPAIRIICNAMKKHGLIVADNGSNWYISGAPDPRWSDDTLGQLKTIPGSAFEVILTVDAQGNPILPNPVRTRVAAHVRAAVPRRSLIFVNGQVNYAPGADANSAPLKEALRFDIQGRKIITGHRDTSTP